MSNRSPALLILLLALSVALGSLIYGSAPHLSPIVRHSSSIGHWLASASAKSRLAASSQHPSSISIPINGLFRRKATTPVDPEPMHGSQTTSSDLTRSSSKIKEIKATGFWL